MWVNKQDLDAIAAEQRRAMKAILDDMKRTRERLDALLGTEANVGSRRETLLRPEPVESSPRRRRRGS
jgi:hypothetical protein